MSGLNARMCRQKRGKVIWDRWGREEEVHWGEDRARWGVSKVGGAGYVTHNND